MNSAAVMVTLIFFAMAPWIIFQWKWSLIVMLPIIGLYLLYLVIRIVIPSGTVSQAYRAGADMLSPLGPRHDSAASGWPRIPASTGRDTAPRWSGRIALEGERHGRHVTMRRESDGPTTISVGGSLPRVHGQVGRRSAARRGGAPPRSAARWAH